jgi:hydrogenase 3 maturation protease
MVPENYLEKVAATYPDTILLIDAADFGGQPGEWRIFSGEDLALTGISTHAGSPQMLAAYLEERTGSEVKLVAMQPGDVGEGEELSNDMRRCVSDLTVELENILGS